MCKLFLATVAVLTAANVLTAADDVICGDRQIESFKDCIRAEFLKIPVGSLDSSQTCFTSKLLVQDCQDQMLETCINDDDYQDFAAIGLELSFELSGKRFELTGCRDPDILEPGTLERKRREATTTTTATTSALGATARRAAPAASSTSTASGTRKCSSDELEKLNKSYLHCGLGHFQPVTDKLSQIESEEAFVTFFDEFCQNNAPALRKCLDLLKACHSASEIEAFEAEAARGADEMRPNLELLTNQLGVELPDLRPCFKLNSAGIKSDQKKQKKKNVFAALSSLVLVSKSFF